MADTRKKAGSLGEVDVPAGKLWGAMSELPSYLDLGTEDTGNATSAQGLPCYEIRYPEDLGRAQRIAGGSTSR